MLVRVLVLAAQHLGLFFLGACDRSQRRLRDAPERVGNGLAYRRDDGAEGAQDGVQAFAGGIEDCGERAWEGSVSARGVGYKEGLPNWDWDWDWAGAYLRTFLLARWCCCWTTWLVLWLLDVLGFLVLYILKCSVFLGEQS